MSTKFLFISILKKTPVILGCLFFLFSFIYPFYYGWFITLAGGGSVNYWSYRVDYRIMITVVLHSSQYWFSNYWFSSYPFIGLGIPWILISLFLLQVLTLIFSVAFVFFNRRILSFEPIIFSIAVLILMIYTGDVISRNTLSNQYQPGYYLVYPSIPMFLFAFILNELQRRDEQNQTKKLNKNSTR